MISKRHGKANNKYMGEDHDSAKPSKFIQYLMQIIFIVGRCVNPLPSEVSSG